MLSHPTSAKMKGYPLSTIAVINLGAHGHVNPTLTMTQELGERGHKVHYFVTADFAAAVQATGAELCAYESDFGQVVPSAATVAAMMPGFPLRLLSEAAATMPQIITRLRQLRPDVILYDPMCVAGRLLAQALSIPAATLHATYAANEHFSLWQSMRLSAPSQSILDDFAVLANNLASTYSIVAPTIKSIRSHSEPLNIVFVPRSFHPESATFDQRYRFVGPGFATRPGSGVWTANQTKRERRLFVSMGTVFNAWPEFFQMTAAAFAATPWDVQMAIGSRVDPKCLGTLSENINAAAYLPQLDILPCAAVAMTHGGMGTTMEALSFGVPLVIIPQMPEQALTARRVAELGLGVMMTRDEATSESLMAAVERVASDATIQSNVARMQQQLDARKHRPGYLLAADAVESYLA